METNGDVMISVHKPNEVKQEKLGPNQLAWLRKNMPGFKDKETIAEKVKRECAENRKQFEKELTGVQQ